MARWYGKEDNCGDWLAETLTRMLPPRIYTDSNGAQRKGFDALRFRDMAVTNGVRLPWPPTDKKKIASWAANGRRKLALTVAEKGVFMWRGHRLTPPQEWIDKILERKSNVDSDISGTDD